MPNAIFEELAADPMPDTDTLAARSRVDSDGSNQRGRVVVVEDDEGIALLLRYNLQAVGFTVETIPSGIAANERLKECSPGSPDLLILDWMLPGLSGVEILRQLRLRAATSNLPVIMLTARNDAEDRKRGLSLGANEFITKPFSLADLLKRVDALLDPSRPRFAGA